MATHELPWKSGLRPFAFARSLASTYGCVPKEEGAQTDGVHLADLYTGCMEATGVSNDFKRTSIIEDVPMTGAGAKTCMEKCKVAGFSNMILYCPNVAPDGSHRVHCSGSILVGAPII